MAKDVVSVFEEDNKTETREFTLLTYHLESELENYPDFDKAKLVSDFFPMTISFCFFSVFCTSVMSLVHQSVCTKIITQNCRYLFQLLWRGIILFTASIVFTIVSTS
jgi:hypothetical protein